ncbi:MAG: polysaccharide export protein [Cyanobacteria bacterium]|nr:polysaccharide export protein [Cyanobacteriota bacterium]
MKRVSVLLSLLLVHGIVPSAIAQTAMPPDVQSDVKPPGASAQQLLEQARQRLRDRGELPSETKPSVQSDVAIPGMIPDPIVPQPSPFSIYRLGPTDVITVYVQRFQDLSFQAAIDQQGKVTHAVLGKISLQGLTIDEAQERVRQAVSRYIINPIVLLSLSTPRPVQVTISGEIAKPGLYPLLQSGGRVSSVLLAAGGTTERGDLRAVKVRRTFTNGTTKEQDIDLYTPLKNGSALPDLRLQDGDVIVIPALDPTKVGDYDRSIVARSTLVKPILTIRILSYARGGLTEVPVPNGSKFVDALAKSGLNPDQANLARVAVIRFDAVQQKAITFEVNGKDALMGDPKQNIALQDSDVIVIGRNFVGRITYALNVFTQPFRDVLGFTLFFRELSKSTSSLFGPTGQ